MRRLAALVLIPAAFLISSCGGDDDKENVQQTLDKAFKQSIKSADLKIEAELQVKGVPSLERPVRIKASGPFRSNPGKLPSTNIELNVGSGGGGQTVSTGFLSTGDRAFVKFQDVYYEQPKSEVAKANESLAKNDNGKQSSLKELGLDPRRWLVDAKERGEEKVGGVDTTHVSGRLDVTALLQDLNKLVRRSQGAIGSTGAQAPQPLSREDLKSVEDVVKDPSFDVYVGKDDDIIRRVAGRVELQVPEKDRQQAGQIQGGSLSFSVEMSDVNGDQKVEAPAKARPISELTNSLGTSALGGLAGGGSGGGAGAQTTPQATQPEEPAAPPSGGTTAPQPDAEAFKKYADCLDQAKPDDSEALQRCAQLLQ